MTETVKRKLSKDSAGALGAGGSAGAFAAFHTDLYNVYEAVFTNIGLTDKALDSATNLATVASVALGSFIVSYIASKFMKK